MVTINHGDDIGAGPMTAPRRFTDVAIPLAICVCVLSLVAAAGLPTAALMAVFASIWPDTLPDGGNVLSWALGIGTCGLVVAIGCVAWLVSIARKLDINIP